LNIKPLDGSCGKVRHYSPDDAERHRQALEASDHAAGRLDGHVIVYWCDACAAFHVGHKLRANEVSP
jgi:hypothetical protein